MDQPENPAPVPVGRFEWERVVRKHLRQPDGTRPPSEWAHVASGTRLVAWVAASYANRDGTSVRPGLDNLIEDTGTSRATVLRALAWLRAEGWLVEVSSRRRAKTDTRGKSTVYRLTIPARLAAEVSSQMTEVSSRIAEVSTDVAESTRDETYTRSGTTQVDQISSSPLGTHCRPQTPASAVGADERVTLDDPRLLVLREQAVRRLTHFGQVPEGQPLLDAMRRYAEQDHDREALALLDAAAPHLSDYMEGTR